MSPSEERKVFGLVDDRGALPVAAFAMVQLDDLSSEVEQVNLPGSADEYPNWRRKLSMTIEQMADDPRACALMSMMSAVRPAPSDDLPVDVGLSIEG